MIKKKDGETAWRAAASYDLGKKYKFKVIQFYINVFLRFLKFKFYEFISVSSHLARTSRTKDTTCYILRSRWFLPDQGSRKSSDSSSIYYGRTISRRSHNRTFTIGKFLNIFDPGLDTELTRTYDLFYFSVPFDEYSRYHRTLS